jgi:hypothetical protein
LPADGVYGNQGCHAALAEARFYTSIIKYPARLPCRVSLGAVANFLLFVISVLIDIA